jgi:cell division protein FtsW
MTRILHDSDYTLIFIVMVLLCIGLIMVYSSSAVTVGEKRADSFFYFKKQFAWAALSMLFFGFFSLTDYRKFQKYVIPFTVATVIMLIAVLAFGKQIRGARRWFDLGLFNFQPSELAKFVSVFFLADYLDRNKSRLKHFAGGFLPALGVVGLLSGLIVLEPDLGVPAVIMLVAVLLFFTGGARLSHILLVMAAGAPLMFYAIKAHSFRMERLMSFLDPWKNAQGASYQLVQSLTSLGSGGVLGKGAGSSDMSKFYLPDAHTDFIFSIIGEEFGVWGTVLVVLLFCAFMYRGYIISRNARDNFGMMLAAGITLTISVQAFFNMAVCTGCVPTKGISLPFISYGGSSLLLALSATGVLANIALTGRKTVKLR